MLRTATDHDVDLIRTLRNQQANREVSVNSHEISPDEHAGWWAKTSVDPTRRVLIYERAGTVAGVVSFFDLELDAAPRTGAWGFFLDADGLAERGETLPAWIEVMSEATGYAFDELGLDELTGEVLEHNTVVRQMNRRFRFTEGEPQTRYADGREITVLPISLLKDNRRKPKGNS
ncbi:RimJ/RimL family protein N-acetyltransferase [Kribbella orskensis]|uniref:RimJ/RimL family protein N-acetyltransferase n=1 Tax=Kribbella orskensis TaxID=2512216 RepID=A0ABY2BKV1_9ACTN|nr:MULTISPECIES: GNAT family N-acetyltransferase [Kribbella]TCN39191.1 RimJ/RimL family protein N-acetyltransferase [Kribbella sp. VKM Ac-2500]TCO21838.1 RimJ/RimL family protein N-acetyltransferase [Kribbella orskensis]